MTLNNKVKENIAFINVFIKAPDFSSEMKRLCSKEQGLFVWYWKLRKTCI